MIVCLSCQTVEGKWREATDEERNEYGVGEDEELNVCLECDAIGEHINYTED